MDAPRKEPDVEPFIPPAVTDAASIIAGRIEGSVYLTGGALLPHVTQDYDLLIQTKMPTDDVQKAIKDMCSDTPGMCLMRIMESYHDAPAGIWRGVVKVRYKGAALDLLIISESDTIRSAMERYPLSIQKQALHLAGPSLYDTPEVYHPDFTPASDNLIIVRSSGAALVKYQKYYPKHGFLLLPGVVV